MEDGAERFSVVADPTGTWSVWDSKKDTPAEMAGSALVDLDRPRALAACGILNRIYRNRLDRCSRIKDMRDDGWE